MNELLPIGFCFAIQKRILLQTERGEGQEIPDIEVLKLGDLLEEKGKKAIEDHV